MPTPANSPAPAGAPQAAPGAERAPVSAELQFLLIAIAFVLVMLLAGVPGHENKAGDGSSALQHGWADRHAAEVAAQQARTSAPAPDAPTPPPESGR